MEDGGLKQQRIKDNVVRGAHKERTRPVFENGIRNQGTRKSILRTNGRRVYEPFRHKFEAKAVKIAVVSPIGLWEPVDGLLWKCRTRRSGRGNAIAAPQGAAAKENGGSRGSGRESHGATTEK
jgi:hypothetical protein